MVVMRKRHVLVSFLLLALVGCQAREDVEVSDPDPVAVSFHGEWEGTWRDTRMGFRERILLSLIQYESVVTGRLEQPPSLVWRAMGKRHDRVVTLNLEPEGFGQAYRLVATNVAGTLRGVWTMKNNPAPDTLAGEGTWDARRISASTQE